MLARRLRDVTERMNVFLPRLDGGLPPSGRPLPSFAGTSVDGVPVSEDDFSGADRILALLTTDCGACRDQVPVLRDLDRGESPQPIVVVIGPDDARKDMVSALSGRAVVVEENGGGPIAGSFGIQDFPALIMAGNGVVTAAGNSLSGVLASAGEPVHPK